MEVSLPSNKPEYIRASWWIMTDPSAPSGLATQPQATAFLRIRERFLFVAGGDAGELGDDPDLQEMVLALAVMVA